jgi:hypothetical protein
VGYSLAPSRAADHASPCSISQLGHLPRYEGDLNLPICAQECLAPNQVTPDQTNCIAPFLCRAGFDCKQKVACESQIDCTACAGGNFSTGGDPCDSCEIGRIANQAHTACQACPSGKDSGKPRSIFLVQTADLLLVTLCRKWGYKSAAHG